MDLCEGKYISCGSCPSHKCCKASAGSYLTSPWVTGEEAEKLNLVGMVDGIVLTNDDNGFPYRLARKDNGDCWFITESGCDISDLRPYDCKMFPYDVLVMEDKYYLVRYTNVCPGDVLWSNEDIDAIVELALPHAKEYAISCDFFGEFTYEVIRELDL